MKKVFRILFIYLGVMLLAGIATVVFCAGFLFFYRDGNIFGIQYISTDEVLYAKETEDMSDLKVIEIYSESFDIKIKANPKVENLMGAMKNKVFGYAKKSKSQASFSLEYDEVTRTAVFESVQPKGWLSKKDAFIEIAIPESMVENGCDIVVRSSKADIKIGGDDEIVVDNIMVEATKGDVNLTNVEIVNGIEATIGSGKMRIGSTCSTTSTIDAVISVGSGVIDFSDINVEKFKFDVIEVKAIKRGKIGILKTNELKTNNNINGGGRIEVGDVGFVDFESLDTDILINNINGLPESDADTSIITITGFGDVSVNKVESALQVNGHNGDIYVNIADETIVLSANQGDIKVDNAIKSVAVDTIYGNIDVRFSEFESEYTQENEFKSIMATTENGHIIVRGLQHGIVSATKKGRISLEYDKVVGNNIINAESGAVNIVVSCPTEDGLENEFAFNLKVASDVNCDIKVGVVGELGPAGSIDYSGQGKEFLNIFNSESETLNNLDVSSGTGIIKIRSRNLVGF